MKILVFAHRFEVSGAQMNAMEPAQRLALRDLHDYEVFFCDTWTNA